MPKAKIAEDVQWFSDVYHDVPNDIFTETGNVRSKYKRPTLVRLLCMFRKRYFHDFPAEYDRWQAELQKMDEEDAASSPQERRDELSDPFYALDEEVVKQFV